MQPGQPRPRRVGGEQLTDLLLGGARAGIGRAQPPHQLQVGQVAGRQLIEPPLPGERQRLERPAPHPADRAQPPPAALVIGIGQVHAPGGDLAGHLDQRERPGLGEAEGLEQRRGLRASTAAEGESASPLTGQRRPSRATSRRWMRRGALVLDELLAHRPGQRLERVGPAVGAQPRMGADGRRRSADQSGSARRTGAGPGRCRGRRACARSPTRRPRGGRPERRTARGRRSSWATRMTTGSSPQCSSRWMTPPRTPGHAVQPDAAREPERPTRASPPGGPRGRSRRRRRPPTAALGQSPGLAIRWTSTRKLREPTIGSASSARRGCAAARELARAVAAHQRQGGSAGDEPRGGDGGGLDGGQRHRRVRLDGAHLGQHGHALHRLLGGDRALHVVDDVGVDDRRGPSSVDCVARHRRHMVTAYAVRFKAATSGARPALRLPLLRCRHR